MSANTVCCRLSLSFVQNVLLLVVPVLTAVAVIFCAFVLFICLCLKKRRKGVTKLSWTEQCPFSLANKNYYLTKQILYLNYQKAKKSELLLNILPSRYTYIIKTIFCKA